MNKLFKFINPSYCCIRYLVIRNCSQTARNIVRVINEADKDFFEISLHIKNVISEDQFMRVTIKKQEEIEVFLSKIKRALYLMKRAYGARYDDVEDKQVKLESECSFEEYDVNLIKNVEGDFKPIEKTTKTVDALIPGSALKINETVYEMNVITSKVSSLRLPDYILVGSTIRPRFKTVFGSKSDFDFTWFRSVSENEISDLNLCPETDILKDENEFLWVKIKEGFAYTVSEKDIGHRLQVTCTPKTAKFSRAISCYSKHEVEACPPFFPFQERHLYTKNFTDNNSIRCVSYNILANMYARRRDSYVDCTEKGKNIGYRLQLILRELLGYNSDIICLQEVEGSDFEFSLLPALETAGYNGIYCMKGTNDNSSNKDKRNRENRNQKGVSLDGLAFFFRTEKFKLVNHYNVLLTRAKTKRKFKELVDAVQKCKNLSKVKNQDTVLQIAVLEHIDNPDRKILVANTHLYSNKEYPEARLIQTAACTYYIEYLLENQFAGTSTATLFCGDFNSLPNSAAFNFITSGCFECPLSWKESTAELNIDSTLNHNLCLDSACGIPSYTNYTKEFQGCLDYIFYSKKLLDILEIVPMPSQELIEQKFLPNELFPSDHLALVCTLKWKDVK